MVYYGDNNIIMAFISISFPLLFISLNRSIFLGVYILAIIFYMVKSPIFRNSLEIVKGESLDEVSFFIVMILLFRFLMRASCQEEANRVSNLNLVVLAVISYYVFVASGLLQLYVFFEASILPISFIILKWGKYPDRSLGILLLVRFTLFFRVPFLIVMVRLYFKLGGLEFINFKVLGVNSTILTILGFIVFRVKLPVWGVHIWLPVAHVEAPTFGSIILAGILLKLGGVGLIRIVPVFNRGVLVSILLVYLIYGAIFRGALCINQRDYKKIIAYRSIFHMRALPILVLRGTELSVKGIIIIMVLHGITSPCLFFLRGVIYKMFGTRQLFLIKGCRRYSNIFLLVIVLLFFRALPAPPFPAFLGEVVFLLSSYSLFPKLLGAVFI